MTQFSDNEDEELQRAIALSQADEGNAEVVDLVDDETEDDDEDADLKRAIALSLAEAQQESIPAVLLNGQSSDGKATQTLGMLLLALANVFLD